MARLTVSDAARVTGVSRMLLYRYIKTGKLSRTPDGLLDTTELLRAGLMLQQSDVTPPVTALHEVTPMRDSMVTPVTPPVTMPVTASVTPDVTTLERLITVLQRELDAARERETTLLHLLSQVQQQNQRLLDAPRPASPVVPPPPPARTDTPPPAPSRAPDVLPSRNTVRQRILALLQEYPEGLTAVEMRVLLRADRRLTDTCSGMLRDGLLRRVGRGRYVPA